MSIRIGEAARIMGVAPQTVRNYCTQGILEYRTTPFGQRIFDESTIRKFMNDPENYRDTPDVTAYYIRVSDGNQVALDNQLRELKDAYGDHENIRVYKDRASGLNENRKGLKKLIHDAEHGRIQHLRITYKDRLTRFGYSYIEHILNTAGVDIEALHEKHETPDEELLNDFMKLIASFSGRLYKMRSIQNQRRLRETADDQLAKRENIPHE